MGTFTVSFDVHNNRLLLVLAGAVDWETARAFTQEACAAAARLRPGFGIIVDASKLENILEDGAYAELRWVQMFLFRQGGRDLVRVFSESSAAQGFVAAGNTHGYCVHTASSVPEAVHMLDEFQFGARRRAS